VRAKCEPRLVVTALVSRVKIAKSIEFGRNMGGNRRGERGFRRELGIRETEPSAGFARGEKFRGGQLFPSLQEPRIGRTSRILFWATY